MKPYIFYPTLLLFLITCALQVFTMTSDFERVRPGARRERKREE